MVRTHSGIPRPGEWRIGNSQVASARCLPGGKGRGTEAAIAVWKRIATDGEPMITKRIALLGTLAAAAAAPQLARAEDPPASPLSFNVGVVTDYRYRGISQSRLRPALQGGADYAFSNGLYLGTWASTIKWIKDNGTIAGVDTGSAPLEIDLYGGYKGDIIKDSLTFDVGGLYYLYAGNKYEKIPGASKADTFEIYGALTYSVATLKYSHSLTNLFGTGGGDGAPNSKGSGYLDLSANFDLGSGFSLTPHVGRQVVHHYGFYSYPDYSLTLGKDFGSGFSASLALLKAHVKKDDTGAWAYPSPSGKNLGKTGVVLGAKYTF
jgi:uncharacterized protein (TIGR02001 family)